LRLESAVDLWQVSAVSERRQGQEEEHSEEHTMDADGSSVAETEGIRVSVRPEYLKARSSPGQRQYAFAYHVTIANEGKRTAQLMTRHWIITHGDGTVEEVRGAGVVGEQPVLKPGQSHQYASGCVLPTPHGTMHGTYHFVREDGTELDAEIAPFLLAVPGSLN
jgi:ApaG protein